MRGIDVLRREQYWHQRSRAVASGSLRIKTIELVCAAGSEIDFDIFLIISDEARRAALKVVLNQSIRRSSVRQRIQLGVGEEKLRDRIDDWQAGITCIRREAVLRVVKLNAVGALRQKRGEVSIAHCLRQNAGGRGSALMLAHAFVVDEKEEAILEDRAAYGSSENRLRVVVLGDNWEICGRWPRYWRQSVLSNKP